MQNATNNFTKPERPVQIYSYWGSTADNVGEDGDFVFEEKSGSLIGPKENGKWPEDLIRIEGSSWVSVDAFRAGEASKNGLAKVKAVS